MLWGQNDSPTFFIRFTVSIRYGNIYNPTYLLELYGLIICFQYSIQNHKNDDKDLIKLLSLKKCFFSHLSPHWRYLVLSSTTSRKIADDQALPLILSTYFFCFQFMAKSFLNYSFHVLYVTFSFCCVLLGSL